MALDTVTVGSNQRQVGLLGDPSAAANTQSVLAVADARSLAGLFAAVVQGAPVLLNAAGTYDIARSAVGTTGIPVVNVEGTKTTYSASKIAFTPAATPTDIAILVGSATKTVRLTRMEISGFATTGISVDLQLFKRLTAFSGGTANAVTTAQHDSNDAAPTAVLSTFSVEPTPGSSGGVVRAAKLNLGATGAAGTIVWTFGDRNSRAAVLRGVAQAFAINWNGAAVPSGTLLCMNVEWTEE